MLIAVGLVIVVGLGGWIFLRDADVQGPTTAPPSDEVEADSSEQHSSASTTSRETRLLDRTLATDVNRDTRQPTDRASTFSIGDGRIYAWAELGQLAGERSVRWEWIDPSGDPTFETTQTVGETNAKQASWPTWSWIPTRPASGGVQTGEWTVEATLDGEALLSETFVLQGEGNAPSCGDLMYRDGFANPESGWVARRGKTSTWAYTDNERYRLSTETANNTIWSWAPIRSDQLPKRFCVDVDVARRAAQSQTENGPIALGLVFGGDSEAPTFTTFDLAPSRQSYRVRSRDFEQEQSEDRVGWTETAPIQGPGQTNRIQIVVQPDQVRFFVEGQQVERLDRQAGGDLGVFVESLGQASADATFDNFRIRKLSP